MMINQPAACRSSGRCVMCRLGSIPFLPRAYIFFSFLFFPLLLLSSSHVLIVVGECYYAWSPFVSPLGRNARGYLRDLVLRASYQ